MGLYYADLWAESFLNRFRENKFSKTFSQIWDFDWLIAKLVLILAIQNQFTFDEINLEMILPQECNQSRIDKKDSGEGK